jgi:hypothetical protein
VVIHRHAGSSKPEVVFKEGVIMRAISIVAAAAAFASSQAAQADAVTDWWEVANRYYLAGQAAPGPRSPDAERASTRTALAVFEAVNAIDRRYQSHLNFPAADPSASQDAAAATAAFKVLLRHYPANKSALDESYAMVMAAIPDGSAKETGKQIGEKAAEAAVSANGVDPAVAQPPYRPRTRPGEWIGTSIPSLEIHWYALTPWVVSSDKLMPPLPPPLGSAEYARDYEEVRRLGARDSKERTLEQTLIARYRQGYDLSPMVRYIADRPGRRQVDNARLLALYQMAFDDAVQAMIIAKYRYDFWRPVTAIRNGDRDGNDLTQHDPTWMPLLPNPNFQEYPCGHCVAAAAQAEVLKLEGGLPQGTPVRVAAGGNPNMVVQTAKDWDELVRQVSDSRMLGGVHYRFSNEAGEEIGRKAARLVVETALRPLSRSKRR